VTNKRRTFSERYGYRKVNNSLVWEEVPMQVRIRIWNALTNIFGMFKKDTSDFLIKIFDKFLREDISGFLKMPIYTLILQDRLLESLKQKFFDFEWDIFFDFIEFLCEYYPDKKVIDRYIPSLNSVLEEEKLAYRIIDGVVTPLTDKEEIKEVEKALNPPDKFAPVREHMRKALKLFSDKREADYQNSIKECMSALDSLTSVIKGKKTTFPNFVRNLDVHKALKDGFLKLYAWSSDAEGIRHGITGEELKPLMAEARYILVTVSAFVNYVISKNGETNG